MGERVKLIIGLFSCFAVAGAVPALFSREKVTTYKYHADVKTGTTKPAPFASQFAIDGLLHVIPDLSDSSLKNAFYINLDVTHGVRNGKIGFEDILENTHPLPEAAKALKDPFLVTFDDNGKIQSLIIDEKEPGWSRNMKQSIASTLQLDISSMNLKIPIKPHSFIAEENNIYGQCSVSYDVNHDPELGEGHFIVTKFMEPMSCSKFNQYIFDSQESLGCLAGEEDDLTTASRRIFNIEYNEEALLIKKLVAHGVMNYVPWNANSEFHYVVVDQIMTFKSAAPMDSTVPPKLNVEKTAVIYDISFQKSQSKFAPNAGVDYTYGRHVVDFEVLVPKLIKMLEEAIDYFAGDNLEMKSPHAKQGQTISRILSALQYMDIPSLEYVHNTIENKKLSNRTVMRNIFLHTVAHGGTDATVLFIRNIVRERKVSDLMAVALLNKLPFFVRVPTSELLLQMENLLEFDDNVGLEVRKASIFCIATLIYKTQRYASHDHKLDPVVLDRYVRYYFDHVMSEPSYEMKSIYIQGMRNIQFGGVHKLLEPIIRGDVKLSEYPEHLRFRAMQVNWRAGRDLEYNHNLHWPILMDTKLDFVTRLTAFTIMFDQPPRMDRLLKLFWFMKNEKNEQVYNYYYTVMKSIANSMDSCMAPYKQMVRKLFPFIKPREAHSNLLTGAWFVDYENEKFGFGESLKLMIGADEHAQIPFCGLIEYTKSKQRKPVSRFTVWFRVEGLGSCVRGIIQEFMTEETYIPPDEIKALLERAKEEMTDAKPLFIEFSVMVQGRFVLSYHFDETNFLNFGKLFQQIKEMEFDLPSVSFDELYVQHVPNDIGLPTHYLNILPSVTDVEARINTPKLFNLQLNASTKVWSHGFYSMEVYNPIVDASHSIHRVSAVDVNFTTSATIGGYTDSTTSLIAFLKYQLPQHSATGIRSDVKNLVEIFRMEKDVLEQYCSTCRLAELVTKGADYRTNLTLFNFDSEDLGLRFSMHQYNCERNLSQSSRANFIDEIFEEDNKFTWNNEEFLGLMAFREWYLNEIINPGVSTCGYVVKLEPSIDHPTSEIMIRLVTGIKSETPAKLTRFPGLNIIVRGTLEAKKTPESDAVQSWSVDSTLTLSEGRLDNKLEVEITKSRPGQNDLKICINGHKTYQDWETDIFGRVFDTNKNTAGNLMIIMGEANGKLCPRDGLKLTITMDAEMSEKQKEVLQHELVHGKCQKDVENPLYLYAETSVVPRTSACLRETILQTTLLKYTFFVVYENIPESITNTIHGFYDIMRADALQYVEYSTGHTEPGSIKITTEFPIRDNVFNFSVRTPFHEEKYTDVPLDVNELDILYDNTRFSWESMNEFQENEMRLCSVYPEVFTNADGAVTPFIFPSKWTLLTSDPETKAFSVFVKRFDNGKFGLLITIGGHEIKVTPFSTIPTITTDDEVVDYQNGFTFTPKDVEDYALWAVWSNNTLLIKFRKVDLTIEWSDRAVALSIGKSLQEEVVGLCGRLDGRYSKSIPKVYSLST